MNLGKRILSFIVILISIYSLDAHAQYTGLRFAGHEIPLDQRTGLNLTPDKPIVFDSDIKLKFELKFEPNYHSYFGYIFRVIVDNQNIDLIYSPQTPESNNFHLVVGDEISGVSFPFPLSELIDHWHSVELEIKKDENQIVLRFDDKEFKDDYTCNEGKSNLNLFFGAHRFNRFNSTDLPNMDIRNINLSQNGLALYSWPLAQHSGNTVEEVIRDFKGVVSNPHWILNIYSNWDMIGEYYFPGKILYGYDTKQRKIEIIQEDSIIYFDLDKKEILSSLPEYKLTPENKLSMVYDSIDEQFILYSRGFNIKSFQSEGSFIEESIRRTVREIVCWHHNPVLNPENNVLYTFGGYGQLTYSNQVALFNDRTDRWDTIKYNGTFYPRYLAGSGYNPADQKVYILGGFGSKSGNQAIRPGYYYDLLTYSFKENTFETLHEFSEENGAFCFAKSLFIDTASNTIFGLKFSKFESISEVQALSISLDDYSLKYLGNTFSFEFLDISSTIDLFFDGSNKNLIAITTYFNNGQTKVNLYQLAYPPLQVETSMQTPNKSSGKKLIYILLGALVISSLLLIFYRRTQKRKNLYSDPKNNQVLTTEPDYNYKNNITPLQKPGSIIIFGGFQVINKDGKDITNSFTPLLKEMFLLIMLSSIRHGKGVSSATLDEIFWFDKSEQAARNNRSVNIGKLKALLETVGNCQISKDTGYWKFEFDPSGIYVDFYEYLNLINTKKIKTKEGVYSLLKIIQVGPAMQNIHADWLDKYKLEISNEIIDNILEYISNEGNNTEPDFIIHLADSIFFFDMVNEEAMIIKCKTLAGLGKHGLAKTAFQKFIKDYKSLYDEEFTKSFNQVLEE